MQYPLELLRNPRVKTIISLPHITNLFTWIRRLRRFISDPRAIRDISYVRSSVDKNYPQKYSTFICAHPKFHISGETKYSAQRGTDARCPFIVAEKYTLVSRRV